MKKENSNKKQIKRTVNYQKIFCFISFIFLAICCLWYGGRAVYFYLATRKTFENEDKLLSIVVLSNNEGNKNFKKIGSDYYFYKDAENNYLTYSNMTWRILKVTRDDEVVLIQDAPVTNLAYGEEKQYKDSYVVEWLNKQKKDYTGILETNLNNKEKYLTKTKECIDTINDVNKATCNKTDNNNYLAIPSVIDYVNTGGKSGFMNNGYYTYLINSNKKNNIWYIDAEGKLNTGDGTDIYGVKATITVKSTVSIIDGDGSKDKPYTIEDKTSLFASYVQLGNDIWRIYEENGNNVKLVLNDYLKIDNENLKYIYSNKNYYHNDTVYGSLAYYLNHNYLRSLTYSDLVVENKYSNYYYGEETNFDYTTLLNNTISTKVTTLSIGDPILNNNAEDYFFATGTSKNDDLVYTIKKNATMESQDISTKAYVVPCISIDKSILKTGTGRIDDPYRTE